MHTDDIQPFSEYRAHLAEHHRRIQETGRPLFVTKNGRTSAVILSPAAFDELTERAQHAFDLEAIRRSLVDIQAGRSRPAAVALRDIAAKLRVNLDT